MSLSKKLSQSLRAQESESEVTDTDPPILETGEGGQINTEDDSSSVTSEQVRAFDAVKAEMLSGLTQSDAAPEFQDTDEELLSELPKPPVWIDSDTSLDLDAEPGEDAELQNELSKVSFGELDRAQAALKSENGGPRKRKRGAEASAEQEQKLDALRKRLRELKAEKEQVKASIKSSRKKHTSAKSPQSETTSDDEGDSNISSSSSDDQPSRSRTSKHAPAVMPSNRAVTRKRKILPDLRPKARDPRFDPLTGPLDNTKVDKNYAFLKSYQSSELADLRATLKKTKSEDDREALKKQIKSLESKAVAEDRKERERRVVSEHNRAERDKVRQGKKPFYLKKSEAKKLALVDKFEGMKKGQRDKAIERRRKKVDQREKRKMPYSRRATG